MIILVNGKKIGETFTDEPFFQVCCRSGWARNLIDDSLKPVLLGTAASNDQHCVNRDRDRF